RDIPVVALPRVEVAGGGLVQGGAVTAVADERERARDVAVDARGEADVQLVAVPVAVRAARVPGLRPAGDVDRAAARVLQRDDALNRGQVDLLEGGAGGRVPVAAAAARRPGDAGGSQHGRRFGVAELG